MIKFKDFIKEEIGGYCTKCNNPNGCTCPQNQSVKTLKLIPYIDASDIPQEAQYELQEQDIHCHYSQDVADIIWDNNHWRGEPESQVELQKWLIETYGPTIKQYDKIVIQGT